MTIDTLSYEIGINRGRLVTLMENSEKFYRVYNIKKKDQGTRVIQEPGIEIKSIQLWILKNILEKFLTPSAYAHGFVKTRSIKSNAKMHLNKKYIYCFDIIDFFPSIKLDTIIKIFCSVENIDKNISEKLAGICSYDSKLPQGGITSPFLSNMAFKELDQIIGDYCDRNSIIYTRYADDLSFSSDYYIDLKNIKPFIQDLLSKAGYSLNDRKERMLSSKGRMSVTGIRLNSKRMTIGRKRKRLIRAMMHNYFIKNNTTIESCLIGHLSFLKDIEPNYYEDSIIPYRQKLISQKNT